MRSICTFDRDHYSEQLYQTLFFTTSLAIPLLAIMWLYMNMLLRLWRGSAAAHGTGPARDRSSAHGARGQENKKRVTRMVVVVIIAFAICWTPLQVVLLLRKFNLYDISDSGGLVVLQIVTHCLAYCNSCLNPILYAFFSPNFRAAFLGTCRSKADKRRLRANTSLTSRRDAAGGREAVATTQQPNCRVAGNTSPADAAKGIELKATPAQEIKPLLERSVHNGGPSKARK